MAELDRGVKQRMVGALVLTALAVIFLPMLFSRPNELRQTQVIAPPMPAVQEIAEAEPAPVVVPDPEPVPDLSADPHAVPADVEAPAEVLAAPAAVKSAAAAVTVPVANAQSQRLDANALPVSWSIQLASLSNRAGALELQQKLRSQGYNAYVRTFDGMNRVFVGPLSERAEADRLRDQLKRKQGFNGFIVRFEPEKG